MPQSPAERKELTIACPKCPPGARKMASLGGLKKHMTQTHGGWTKDDLNNIGTGAEGAAVTGEENFQGYAAKQPENAADAYRIPDPADPVAVAKDAAAKQAERTQKRIRAGMDGLKHTIAEAIPLAGVEFMVNNYGEDWKIPKDKLKPIVEALEGMAEALGVEFQVEPMNVQLRSKWWLFLWPILAAFGVVAVHAVSIAKKNAAETAPEATLPGQPEPETKPVAE
jgi:hypothetical protein